VTSITVTPTRQDPNATITVNGQPTNSGQVQTIALSGPGTNTFTNIVVTAPNGAQKTYAVEVSRAVRVEPEPERLEPTMASAVGWDSPRGSFSSQGETKFSGVSQESAQVGEDRPSEATGLAPFTKSFPYLSIGLGILAVLGALVYFIVFSQGPSPGPKAVVSDQYTVQQSTTRPEVITPTPAPAPVTLPTAVTTPEKSTAKQRAGPAKTITGKDGAPMALVPAGNFWMGSPDSGGDNDEHPRHRVVLSAFYLDRHEVTNRLFQQFVQQTSHRTTAEQEGKAWALTAAGKGEEVSGAQWRNPEGGETVFASNRENHPVVSVSWNDAEAYCRWAGKRLPTEAEFEYATRGGTETTYWWGNGNPGSHRVANIADESAKRQYSDWTIMTGYDDGYIRTASVGSFETNLFGLHDMTGNVWEWTADWYDKTYYRNSPERNPKGPPSGSYRVLRGGSWGNDPGLVRSAYRGGDTPTRRDDLFGFRCAQDRPN
jgi:formylglycine-generating enzyme